MEQKSKNWLSIRQLFESLKPDVSWIVLRNAEFLPDEFWDNDKDIDILCSDRELLVSKIGALRRDGSEASYHVNINGRMLELDIREVGDDYYCSKWSARMLSDKRYINDLVPITGKDDYLYSLLYHAVVHKINIKEKYKEEFKAEFGSVTDRQLKCLLTDYMKKQKYNVMLPKDETCWYNYNYVNSLRCGGYKDIINKFSIRLSKVLLYRLFIRMNNRFIPKSIKSIIFKAVVKSD